MAITTMDGLVAALPGQMRQVMKSYTSPAAGSYISLWTAPGIPGAAVAPSSAIGGDIPTSATAGAIPYTNPTAPALTYLGTVAPNCSQNGMVIIFDRLWHNGSTAISVTTTSAQTVNSTALTRPDANGTNVELWLQVYTTMGAAVPTITASYTDQDGNSGNTATAQGIVTGATANRCFPFNLASGDTGVRSVQSVTISTSWLSGTFGLVLRRRIATVPLMSASTAVLLDPFMGGMPQIYDSSCLEFMWVSNNITGATLNTPISLLQG